MVTQTTNKVTRRILSMEKGSIFFPSDFYDIATPDGARKTLSRLVDHGLIVRVCQGVYCYPRENRMLGLKNLPAPSDDIAHRIAERDKVKIIPTGETALYLTGLSTQVPANAVYLTNGSRKLLNLGNGRKIVFRESNESRLFEFQSPLMMLIVSAMRSIGELSITDDQISHLKELAKNVSPNIFLSDLHLAPLWVKNKLATL